MSHGYQDLLRNPSAFFQLNSLTLKIVNGFNDEANQEAMVLLREGHFRFTNPDVGYYLKSS